MTNNGWLLMLFATERADDVRGSLGQVATGMSDAGGFDWFSFFKGIGIDPTLLSSQTDFFAPAKQTLSHFSTCNPALLCRKISLVTDSKRQHQRNIRALVRVTATGKVGSRAGRGVFPEARSIPRR
eukprot:1346570-Rhodomonas_salina.1